MSRWAIGVKLALVSTRARVCDAGVGAGRFDGRRRRVHQRDFRGLINIPVYVRDVSGTPLGVDQGAGNLQAISFRVVPTPASAIALRMVAAT